MFNCSRCSAILRSGAIFCSQCGLHFEQPVPGYEGKSDSLTQLQAISSTQTAGIRLAIEARIIGFMMFAWWVFLALGLIISVIAGSYGEMAFFCLLLPLAGTTIWLQHKWQMVHKALVSAIFVATMLGFGIYSLSPSGKAAKIAEQQNYADQKKKDAEAQIIENQRVAEIRCVPKPS